MGMFKKALTPWMSYKRARGLSPDAGIFGFQGDPAKNVLTTSLAGPAPVFIRRNQTAFDVMPRQYVGSGVPIPPVSPVIQGTATNPLVNQMTAAQAALQSLLKGSS